MLRLLQPKKAERPMLVTINSSQLTICDLHGRSVEKAEKGIYIIDGKKVVVK